MGTEIAFVFALAGHEVVLCDRDEGALARAMARMTKLLERDAAKAADPIGVPARIAPGVDFAALSGCRLVIEAVFEAVDAKTAVLKAIDAACPADCLIGTNTSTLPISTLAATLPPARRPHFLGTHFFSPVSRMPLVEVVPAFETAGATVDAAVDLLRDIGKTPIVVKDVAGFAVNRMLHAFLIEAVRLVEDGVASAADIDTACRLGLGHPVGPFALMDLVTSSLTLQVQQILHDVYGERFRPPALLKQQVAAGRVGGRGRRGWLAPDGGVTG